MKIIVPIPVYGRLPLLKLTIERLYTKNKVHKVICVGEGVRTRELCESLGAEWIEFPNIPLGAKWNAGFLACKKYNPDAVLFAGSSDWVSDTYLPHVEMLLNDKYDLIGKNGCYFAHVTNRIDAVYWDGYTDEKRKGEPIGIGRVLSAKLLDEIQWKPFEDNLTHNLDFSMWNKSKDGNVFIFSARDPSLVSISTNKWENKHRFSDHIDHTLESELVMNINELTDDYPELENLID